MNSNEILENVMTFINENTNILIGICIFLIFVLIGYLIDNSVKSKRVRKNIKNKDQVPENIKKDIIEEAIDKKEVNPIELEDIKDAEEKLDSTTHESIEPDDKVDSEEKTDNEFENFISDSASPLDLNINTNATDNNVELNNQEGSMTVPLEEESNTIDTSGDIDQQSEIVVPSDIMSELMNSSNVLDLNNSLNEEKQTNDIPYKNNKKLSEILYNSEEKTDLGDNIPYNESIDNMPFKENNEDKKESSNSYDDELDNIMKKLNNINNTENFDEDNYTNIF